MFYGPITCEIFLNDLMFLIKETAGFTFVNGTTIYACFSGYQEGSQKLSNDTHVALNWFGNKTMFTNPEKTQIMFF